MQKTVIFVGLGLLGIVLMILIMVPPAIEKSTNLVLPYDGEPPSAAAIALHKTLIIGDLHTDTTLWQRDMLELNDYGHVDVPRLLKGNVGMQMFTSVTKSPQGQNYDSNPGDAADNITSLALVQGWPVSTWNNLTERALYQAERLTRVTRSAPEQIVLVKDRSQLIDWLAQRRKGSRVVAAFLGTEGSHALAGDVDNVDKLFEAGFRMMSLQHFFDNELGGSLHGINQTGLTEFGRAAVERMQELGVMVDVSHSAPQVVSDVLAMSTAPLIVSHTGFHGHCPSPRNISDELMQRIAAGGGLIGVGFWDAAVCDFTPDGIVAAIRYGIDLTGENHIALGSDFDGGVTTYFDTAGLVLLTDAMLRAEFTETEIRKVMGENMLRYLRANLPQPPV